jgi:hypothetical protein
VAIEGRHVLAEAIRSCQFGGTPESAADDAEEMISKVTVAPDVCSMVRVDVTSAVQQWYAQGQVREGLMLETETTRSSIFAGLGSSSLLRRTHVKVVFR